MNEELLQYIWQAGLFNANSLKTSDNQDITIYLRGKLNSDSGPDFSNARVRIGDTEWIGNIEIHLRSDEWKLHKHHTDKAYNNVILHVVYENNSACFREDGTELICIELKDRIPASVFDRYTFLKESENWIPCASRIQAIDSFTISQTLQRALVQRLERKCRRIDLWLKEANNDWNSVFYHALARSFGFGTNSEAFEQIALNLPLHLLYKHKDNTLQTEAMVFGVAGFLDEPLGDEYYSALKNEWVFLKHKYSLPNLEKSSFKFMRMRPGNFPGIRLAQFSALAVKCNELFQSIREKPELHAMKSILQCTVSPYWENHFYFSKMSSPHRSNLTEKAIVHLLINGVLPVLFMYGKHVGDTKIPGIVMECYEQLPPEDNHIVRNWSELGIQSRSAFESQAVLELKQEYCDEKKCLKCSIGNKIMNSNE